MYIYVTRFKVHIAQPTMTTRSESDDEELFGLPSVHVSSSDPPSACAEPAPALPVTAHIDGDSSDGSDDIFSSGRIDAAPPSTPLPTSTPPPPHTLPPLAPAVPSHNVREKSVVPVGVSISDSIHAADSAPRSSRAAPVWKNKRLSNRHGWLSGILFDTTAAPARRFATPVPAWRPAKHFWAVAKRNGWLKHVLDGPVELEHKFGSDCSGGNAPGFALRGVATELAEDGVTLRIVDEMGSEGPTARNVLHIILGGILSSCIPHNIRRIVR